MQLTTNKMENVSSMSPACFILLIQSQNISGEEAYLATECTNLGQNGIQSNINKAIVVKQK